MRSSILIVAVVLAARSAAGIVTISVDRVDAGSSGQIVVGVRLSTGGAAVGGTQNDLVFDHRVVRLASAAACRINPDIGDRLAACEEDPPSAPCKTLTRHLADCSSGSAPGCEAGLATQSRLRAIIAATAVPNRGSIPDGTLLYSCTFDIIGASGLPTAIVSRNVAASDPLGDRLVTTSIDGRIDGIGPPTGTPTPTATSTPTPGPPVLIDVADVVAGGASQVDVPVTLRTRGNAVGGAQADIVFDTRAVRLSGDSSCQVGAEISDRDPACDAADTGGRPCKSLSRDLASCGELPLPPGCPERNPNLARFRGLVASTRILGRSTIPDGATLFSCRFEIVAASRLPTLLSIGRALSSGPIGTSVSTVGANGSVSSVPLPSPLPTWTTMPTATARPTSTFVPSRTPTFTRTPSATRTTTATFTITPTFTITATPEPVVVVEVRPSQVEDKVTVPVYVHSHGLELGGVQNDLLFDTRLIRLARASDCRINPAIGTSRPGCDADPVEGACKTLARSLVLCGEYPLAQGCEGRPAYVARFRAIVAATAVPNANAIPDGLLYSCDFTAQGPAHITTQFVVASTPLGDRLPAVGDDGYVGNLDEGEAGAPPTWTPIYPTAPPTNTAAPATATPTAAATAVATRTMTATGTAAPVLARLWLREAPEAADGEALVELVLDTAGEDVGGMQSDLIFDGRALALDSATDCKINPEIGDRDANCEEDTQNIVKPCKTLNRNLVSCGEQPEAPGCEGQGADHWRFRGIVAATAVPNNIPIPDGSVLYTCRFRIVDANHLSTRIEQINAVLAGPTGERLAVVPLNLILGAVPTPTPQVMGYPCTAGDQCASGFCVDATCCSTASCPPNQYCDVTDSLGDCSPRHVILDGCNADSDCLTGNCDVTRPDLPQGLYGVCGPVRTPTPGTGGQECSDDGQCPEGLVCNTTEGGLCCEMKECPGGSSCRVPGHLRVCRALPAATPESTATGTAAPPPQEATPTSSVRTMTPTTIGTAAATRTLSANDGTPHWVTPSRRREDLGCAIGPSGANRSATAPRAGSGGWLAVGLLALFASRRRWF